MLGVLVLSGVLLWASQLIPYDDSESSYIYFCSVGKERYAVELKDDRYLFSREEGYKILAALHRKYPSDFLLDKDGQYILPSDFKIDYVKVKFSLTGQIKDIASNSALFLLFVAYPAYVIFHFISWAIRLLAENN
jgi:hypothetical protein